MEVLTKETEAAASNDLEEVRDAASEYLGSPVNGLVSETFRTWSSIRSELSGMAPIVGPAAAAGILRRIRAFAADLVRQIEAEIMTCSIKPWSPMRLSEGSPALPPSWSAMSIGVYPLSSRLIDWRSILAGLAAMAQLQLDRVVYVLTDDGAAPDITLRKEALEDIAQRLLIRFSPLLEFSPVAKGTGMGEIEAFFRLLQLNSAQPMTVHYIVECASGFPCSPSRTETIEQMKNVVSNGLYGYNSRSHHISLALSGRTGSRGARCLHSPFRTWISRFPACPRGSSPAASLRIRTSRPSPRCHSPRSRATRAAGGFEGQSRAFGQLRDLSSYRHSSSCSERLR